MLLIYFMNKYMFKYLLNRNQVRKAVSLHDYIFGINMKFGIESFFGLIEAGVYSYATLYAGISYMSHLDKITDRDATGDVALMFPFIIYCGILTTIFGGIIPSIRCANALYKKRLYVINYP